MLNFLQMRFCVFSLLLLLIISFKVGYKTTAAIANLGQISTKTYMKRYNEGIIYNKISFAMRNLN